MKKLSLSWSCVKDAKRPAACAGIIAFLYAFGAQAAGAPPHWEIVPDKSTIEWTAQYAGKPVSGSFPAFTADIAFDPEELAGSHARVKIDTGKVASNDKDAKESLPTGDWFASDAFPAAMFESVEIKVYPLSNVAATTRVAFIGYEADGTLTVRDKSVQVHLPFTAMFTQDAAGTARLFPSGPYVRIDGATFVKRTQLGVGQGDWAGTQTIADDVKITVHLEARRVP